jgi:hypothetical protein
MSTLSAILPMQTPLISRRTRAYYAPVNRMSGAPTIFDPALQSGWSDSAPPSPWVDLGWIADFTRSAESGIAEVDSGTPATIALQTRTKLGATVSLRFAAWSKLTMALATGSQHMNVLAAPATAAPIGSGAKATAAVGLAATSTAQTLYLAAQPATPVQAGAIVVVDVDYASQTGFVGTGISGAYVASAAVVGNDPDYVRRVSFNVGRVIAVGADGGLQLASPLPAGTPSGAMKVQALTGFLDREGGNFFHEWSALFVMEGVQGDRLFLHYPRLQTCQSAQEATVPLIGTVAMVQPSAMFRALPVVDGNDGEQVVCYRTYQPPRFSYV